MQFFISLVSFSFAMGLIVFIHELGHFLAAKHYGVYCSEFAIGMGPKIYSIKKNETTYTIRLLPIGGYVAMAGEAENNDDLKDVPFERTINGIRKIPKIVILLAGIFMNVLLAFVIYIGIYLTVGSARVEGPIIVNEVSQNTNAAKLGLQENDQITAIHLENQRHIEIKDFNDALTYLVVEKVDSIDVQRGNEKLKLKMIKVPEKETVFDGSQLSPQVKKISWYETPIYALKKIKNDSLTIVRTLSNLIKGIGVKHLSGPVGIFNIVGNVAQKGLIPLFALIALLSINIGLFNAIPLPALDGGRVVLTILEKIMGKYYSRKVENYLVIGSFLLLFGLIILITFQDIIKLF